MKHRNRFVLALSGLIFIFSTNHVFAQTDGSIQPSDLLVTPPSIVGKQIAIYVICGLIGFAIGAILSDRFKQIRRYMWMALGGLILLASLVAPYPLNGLLSGPVAFVIFLIAIGLGLAWGRIARKKGGRSTVFGSAQWATLDVLQKRGLIGSEGLILGDFDSDQKLFPMQYTGDRHLLTVAPTRAGKGVSAIIPNLLTYRGSVIVIDPKGENAMITALRRKEGLGQAVHIVDPWGLTSAVTGLPAACFNPLDWIDPTSPDASENAMMLADSLVVPPPGGSKDPFWDEESKALLMGIILYVVTDPTEEGQRHLGRVRDILMLSVKKFEDVMLRMDKSTNAIVAGTAARTVSKEPKLLSSVLSAVQSHTHILDSPSLRESLSRSDFRFEDIKRTPTTVYLVLPADRLGTFGRWLRLLVQQAITVTARDVETKPERPILFLLDEMAALGRLTAVEQAYGLMAGFGMQLWGIVQDLSQLARIYGQDGWQTFIGNSGVLQYFGSRDQMTADYFSALCGTATVQTLSSTLARAFSSNSSPQGGSSGSSESTSHSYGETSRRLAMADELMRISSDVELVLVENLDPITGRKIVWYQDDRFKALGRNLQSTKSAAPRPISQAPVVGAYTPFPSMPEGSITFSRGSGRQNHDGTG